MAQKTKTFNHESASATTEQALESKTTQMMGVSECDISVGQESRVQAYACASHVEPLVTGMLCGSQK